MKESVTAMRNLFQKKKVLLAACHGEVCPIAEIPDEAFASGMLGQGYAIRPSDGAFFSPVKGKIASVAETKHAYTILTCDGLDLLVHIGVDTVTLGGDGFTPLVREGDEVEAGAPLAKVDLSLLEARGIPTITAVLLTDAERLTNIECRMGRASGGRDAVFSFRIGGKG